MSPTFLFMQSLKCHSIRNDIRNAPDSLFDMVESFVDWLEEMSGFKDIDRKRLLYGVFLALWPTIKAKQTDFSRYYNVSENSLSKWKYELSVMKVRNTIMDHCLHSEVGNALFNLLDATLWRNSRTGKVNIQAIKLFLDYVEFWEIDWRSFRAKSSSIFEEEPPVYWNYQNN